MKKFLFLFIVLIAGLSFGLRLLPHLPNFTPIGALALFIGAYLPALPTGQAGGRQALGKKYQWSLALPLAAMFASDLFIGFYDARLMLAVYASFFAYSLIGILVTRQKNAGTIFAGAFFGGLLFYLVTNFAVWAFSPWYPHTLAGLFMSYALALPFFKYTILGDLFFTGVFFGAYELASAYLFGLQKQKQAA